MITKFILFIMVLLGVLFGSHIYLHISIVRFFSITNPAVRVHLLTILICMSVSFIASALLLHLHWNCVTRTFYIFSSIWLGLLINFMMAATILWMCYGLGKLMGYTPNMRFISVLIFFVAIGFSIYGIWNAFHPRLKNITVEIENLPKHWKNKTIVQLSDVHLGAINGNRFLKYIVDRVNALKPELIMITGDLFDGMDGNLDSFIKLLNSFKASKGLFMVTGNHEGYLGLTKPLSVLKKTSITVLDNEFSVIDGIQIVGIRFPEHDKPNKLEHLFGNKGTFNPLIPSILLYHTPTNIFESNQDRASQQLSTYWLPDTDMTASKRLGIDLQLSGHTHKGQIFPFGYLTHLIYRGRDYGIYKDGNFTLYTTSGVGTWGPPLRTGSISEIVVIKLVARDD